MSKYIYWQDRVGKKNEKYPENNKNESKLFSSGGFYV